MNNFLNFENFLLEKMGVPTSMLGYAKILSSKVLETLEAYTDLSNQTKNFTDAFGISIPLESKSDVDVSANDEKILWKVFLNVSLKKVENEELKDYGNPIVVEGSSSGFQVSKNKNPTTTVNIDITAEHDVIDNGEWNKYQKLITSTILHELTHVYEDMSRRKHDSSIPSSRDKAFVIVSDIVRSKNIPYPIFDFFYLVYLESSHEINARIAQVYSLIEDEKDPEKKLKILKASFSWQTAERLIAWNVKDFIASFNKMRFDRSYGDNLSDKEKVKIVMNDIDSFILAIKPNIIEDFKEEINFIKPANIDKFFEDVSKNFTHAEKIFKKDVFAQLNYWENAFHKAGEKSKRKMLKIISYDEE